MKSVAVVLMLLLPAHAVAAGVGVVKSRGFGCKSLEDFERAVEIATEGDQAAFMKFLLAKINSRDCMGLRPTTRVYTEKRQDPRRLCVRPAGEVDCYWTDATILD